MGQQQLLLVILVTIIVGIATVVAINIFGTAADQANRDAVRQDLMAAAVQAQAIWARPEMMNGAGRDFGNLTDPEILARLNIPSDADFDPGTSTSLVNENGTYTIQASAERSLTIRGVPASGGTDDFFEIQVQRNDNTGNWEVTLTGPDGEEGDGGTAT